MCGNMKRPNNCVPRRCGFGASWWFVPLAVGLLLAACAGEPPADSCPAPAVLKDGKCTFTPADDSCAKSSKVFVDGKCYDCPAEAPFDPASKSCVATDAGAVADGTADSDAGATDSGGPDAIAGADADGSGEDAGGSVQDGGGSAGDAKGPGVDAVVAPCEPACTDKACGADGCGGICGTCSSLNGKPNCVAGKCVAVGCKPDCENSECGPDGCGGICGSCKVGQFCAMHHCHDPAEASLCAGNCGKAFADQSCSCKPGCDQSKTEPCCKGYDLACACTPTCAADSCGDDGCGGTCGQCKSGQVCAADKCVNDPCEPDPCNGHGTCAGAGACTCNAGFGGGKCDACAPGLSGYPDCKPDACAGQTCSGKGKCASKTGACACDPGFSGALCHACTDSSQGWPDCKAVDDKCAALPNAATGCDDGNACTKDSCDPKVGCQHEAVSGACDDGQPCTTGETCTKGACGGGQPACAIAVNTDDDSDDGTCDSKHCSLREAIGAANAKPDATLIGFGGDYTIKLGKPLATITTTVGLDHLGHKVVVDGGGAHQCFHAKASFSMVGLTVQNCGGSSVHYGGAVRQESAGGGSFVNVTFKDNKALYRGGAVWAGGALAMQGCTFSGNHVISSTTPDPKDPQTPAGGGALYVAAAGVSVSGCTFTGNVAGAKPQGSQPGPNDLLGYGGALVASGSFAVQIVASTFEGNTATGAGAMAIAANATVINCTLVGNKAHVEAGAVMVGQGTVKIVHCTLANNEATQAYSSLLNSGGTLTLANTIIAGGKGKGPECGGANQLTTSIKNLIQDGTCSASLKGDPQLVGLADNGGKTQTMALKKGTAAVDAADGESCKLANGVDQRDVKRPQGSQCDIGAFELAATP